MSSHKSTAVSWLGGVLSARGHLFLALQPTGRMYPMTAHDKTVVTEELLISWWCACVRCKLTLMETMRRNTVAEDIELDRIQVIRHFV
jgi:hypothetical protein